MLGFKKKCNLMNLNPAGAAQATHGSIAFSPLSQAMQIGNLTLPRDLDFVYPSLDAVY